MLTLKTQNASKVVYELANNNKYLIDELVENTDFGFGWLLKQFKASHTVVDSKLVDLLTVFCVCDNKAIRDAQDKIVMELFAGDQGPLQSGTFFKMTLDKEAPVIFRKEKRINLIDCSTTISGQGIESNYAFDYSVVKGEEDNIRLFVSQLKLYVAACVGCCHMAENYLTPIAPFDVVFALANNQKLTYRIRSVAISLLFVLHIETVNNRPVVTKDSFAVAWNTKVSCQFLYFLSYATIRFLPSELRSTLSPTNNS